MCLPQASAALRRRLQLGATALPGRGGRRSKEAERLLCHNIAAAQAVDLPGQVIGQEGCCAVLLWRAASQHLHARTGCNPPSMCPRLLRLQYLCRCMLHLVLHANQCRLSQVQ